MTEKSTQHQSDRGVALAEAKPKVKRPPMYKVILINDDYTPMDFVVHVLERFFLMPKQQATRIMQEVHTKGKGLCGVFTHEIAETKVTRVNEYAREQEYPLLCVMEKA